MQFDKGVSDILATIGKALQTHLSDINKQQQKYIETYNAVMKIPVVQELLNENNKLKNELHMMQTKITNTSKNNSTNISLEIKDVDSNINGSIERIWREDEYNKTSNMNNNIMNKDQQKLTDLESIILKQQDSEGGEEEEAEEEEEVEVTDDGEEEEEAEEEEVEVTDDGEEEEEAEEEAEEEEEEEEVDNR